MNITIFLLQLGAGWVGTVVWLLPPEVTTRVSLDI